MPEISTKREDVGAAGRCEEGGGMSTKAAKAIAALRNRDVSHYREARRAYHAADLAYEMAGKAIAIDGAKHYRSLEMDMVKALAPHRIEWKRYGQPSGAEFGGGDVNHSDWCASAHLSGEVWPEPKGGRYNMRLRAHIPFSLSPRDGDEFWRSVWLLKAAADAMAEGGL
jgi:hypothetical protein